MARVLPREDWPRLAGTELEQVWPVLGDADRVLVVEADGAIVGAVALMQRWWADGVWLHPQYRHGGVARALIRAIGDEAGQVTSALMVPVERDVMRKFFARVPSHRLSGEVYVWALKQP